MSNELQTVLAENEIENPQQLESVFSPLFQQAKEWEEKAKKIVVTSVDQEEAMQQAREARLALKNIRVEADKKRKEMKESILREGNAIQGMYNIIKFLIVPLEEYLEEQEKFAEREEEKRRLALKASREAELLKYGVDIEYIKVEEMDDDVYQQFSSKAKAEHEAKIEAEKKAEEEQIAREKAEAEEQERTRKENEKLKKDAEEREKKLAIERKKLEAERKEREKVEAELKRREEEKLQKEKEEKERLKREAEAKAKAEREAKLAPDKKKLEQLAVRIVEIELPSVKSKEAKQILIAVQELLGKTSNYIKEKTINL